MASLEDEGYITQPHTSAGRIPTDKGYRMFVDRLATVKALSAAERRAIETFLTGAVDVDDVVQRSVKVLAQLTNQVAIVSDDPGMALRTLATLREQCWSTRRSSRSSLSRRSMRSSIGMRRACCHSGRLSLQIHAVGSCLETFSTWQHQKRDSIRMHRLGGSTLSLWTSTIRRTSFSIRRTRTFTNPWG